MNEVERFEQYVSNAEPKYMRSLVKLTKNDDGTYSWKSTQFMWELWQAAQYATAVSKNGG